MSIPNIQPTNYVKLNATPNDYVPRYYAVPQRNAYAFQKQFEKQKHKVSILTNTVFLTTIIAGVFGMALATRNIKNTFIRIALNSTGGAGLGLGAFVLCGKYAQKEQTKMEHKYGAIKLKG